MYEVGRCLWCKRQSHKKYPVVLFASRYPTFAIHHTEYHRQAVPQKKHMRAGGTRHTIKHDLLAERLFYRQKTNRRKIGQIFSYFRYVLQKVYLFGCCMRFRSKTNLWHLFFVGDTLCAYFSMSQYITILCFLPYFNMVCQREQEGVFLDFSHKNRYLIDSCE